MAKNFGICRGNSIRAVDYWKKQQVLCPNALPAFASNYLVFYVVAIAPNQYLNFVSKKLKTSR
ncbi:MAG: hypothetical protein F6K35_43640 [Okeania sp. SIO2H7]|nr:hypothetical protein [Okeania sp. SIO2H7]